MRQRSENSYLKNKHKLHNSCSSATNRGPQGGVIAARTRSSLKYENCDELQQEKRTVDNVRALENCNSHVHGTAVSGLFVPLAIRIMDSSVRVYSKLVKKQEVKVIWQKAPHGGPLPG